MAPCRLACMTSIVAMTVVLTGCIGLLGPEQPTPEHVGPHRVGVTTIDVEDESRDRDLRVEVWYPADASTKAKTAPVVYRLKAAGTIVARLRSRVGALRNAKVSRDGGARPVVLFSHGAGSNRYGNAILAEVLASHGYVVAAPDHSGHSTADKVFGISDEDRAKSAYDRPVDLSRVLDELVARSDDARSLLQGAVDADRVAVAGHSFGGRAALGMVGARFDSRRQANECSARSEDRRCLAVPVFGAAEYRYRDPRVKAAVVLAPAGFDFYRADGIGAVDAPVLVVGADRDQTTPFGRFHRPTFEALTGARYMLKLQNAGHLSVTDVCTPDRLDRLSRQGGGRARGTRRVWRRLRLARRGSRSSDPRCLAVFGSLSPRSTGQRARLERRARPSCDVHVELSFGALDTEDASFRIRARLTKQPARMKYRAPWVARGLRRCRARRGSSRPRDR